VEAGDHLWYNTGVRRDLVRIVLADDHEITRAGLKSMIGQHEDWVVCGEAANGAEAVAQVLELKPDLVLLDITMPVMDGIQAAMEIRQLVPSTKILFLLMFDTPAMSDTLLSVGADGCLSKTVSAEKLRETVVAVVNGRQPA
jgi:two-component system nitrate/nitrite response regulator NarL